MKKKIVSILLCLTLVACMAAGCGEKKAEDGGKSEAKSSESKSDGDAVVKKGDYVIGLSNSYFGNTWRKQMVGAFTNSAEDVYKRQDRRKYGCKGYEGVGQGPSGGTGAGSRPRDQKGRIFLSGGGGSDHLLFSR